MKFIDLFGGVGGFRLGIEKATKKKWKCIWYCDNDKYAVQTYNKNFKENWKPTDIRKVRSKAIPEHDLICAGFPCQAFSIAGKRKGFQDTRGTLFYEICRIASHHRTPYLFLENVKGLLSHNKGRTFAVILSALDELGYDVQWQVLNSKHFGVPQNRERVFIIASLRGKPRPKVFPIGESYKDISQKLREGISESQTLTSTYWKGGKGTNIQMIYETGKFGEKGFREYKDITPTLQQSMGTGGHNVPMILASRGRNPDNPNDRKTGSPTEQRLEINSEGICNTLSSVQKDNLVASCLHGTHKEFNEILPKKLGIIRRLTPIECERLQGFPDNFSKYGLNEKGEEVLISDTQRYKQMGNAVTTNVIYAIVEKWK